MYPKCSLAVAILFLCCYYLCLLADMKESGDDASISDSAFGSCSVVTGSTFIGTVHGQQYHGVRNYGIKLLYSGYVVTKDLARNLGSLF